MSGRTRVTVSIRGAEKGILYILTGEKRVMGKRAVQLSKMDRIQHNHSAGKYMTVVVCI